MDKVFLKKSYPVLVLLVACAALILVVALWVGPSEPKNVELVSDKTLEAPLAPEKLAAYDVDMTSKNNPVAVLNTSAGVIEIELYEDTMPITSGNFKKLVKEGFYDGIKFHRVIEGFMVQGGDPITKTDEVLRYGTGGPGYSIPDEHIKGQYLTNVRGTISMANSGPNSGGSQFFLNLADNTNLDFDKPPQQSAHPVFGRIVGGMDVLDAIGAVATNAADQPVTPVVIESATIKE